MAASGHAVIDWNHVTFKGLEIRRFPAAGFRAGFETMLSANSGKVILDWTAL
jgi:hypothetical protein